MQVVLENKSMWAMNTLRMDWNEAVAKRLNGLNEVDELHVKAYESSANYKENMKKYHDQKIEKRAFVVGDVVLLLNSTIRLLSRKFKSWMRPFIIAKLFPHGSLDLEN